MTQQPEFLAPQSDSIFDPPMVSSGDPADIVMPTAVGVPEVTEMTILPHVTTAPAAPILTVVTPHTQQIVTAQPAPPVPSPTPTLVPGMVPSFEGSAVEGATFEIVGKPENMANDEAVITFGDAVRMVGTYRCVGVSFKLNPKTGDLIRVQRLKPLDLELCPWDPSDPKDDGIVRAKPVLP